MRQRKRAIIKTTIINSNIVRMIKSRRMRWVGHVARMGEMRNAYNILVGNLKVKDQKTTQKI
jgi:hypothetical protein